MGRTEITTLVETSDCFIILGAFMTNVNLGIYTANLARSRCVYATSDKITVCYSTYEDVTFEDFLDGLCSPQLHKRPEVNLEWVLVPHQVLIDGS